MYLINKLKYGSLMSGRSEGKSVIIQVGPRKPGDRGTLAGDNVQSEVAPKPHSLALPTPCRQALRLADTHYPDRSELIPRKPQTE